MPGPAMTKGFRGDDMPGKVKWFFDHLEEVICAALMLIMATLCFVNVVTRYFIHYSLAFTEEIEVSFLVYLTMFGAAAGFRRGAHLGLSFLVNRFPQRLQRLIALFSAMLTVALFAVLIYFSILQIEDEILLETVSEALEVPEWWYTLAIPVGALLVIYRVVEATMQIHRGEEGS
jgi:TRAP-type C4-dicarboxylate transport system permease small subunit